MRYFSIAYTDKQEEKVGSEGKNHSCMGVSEPGAFTVAAYPGMHDIDLFFFVFVEEFVEHLNIFYRGDIAR